MILSFQFTPEEVNLIHEALINMPMKVSEGLVAKIRQESDAQVNAAKEAEIEAAKKPTKK